jgi:hypothetical protein
LMGMGSDKAWRVVGHLGGTRGSEAVLDMVQGYLGAILVRGLYSTRGCTICISDQMLGIHNVVLAQ